MKLELKVEGERQKDNSYPLAMIENKDEAVIDIASVLAANQALLKNISLKMEALEKKIQGLEADIRRQAREKKLERFQKRLLLEPPKTVTPWRPEYPELDSDYFSQFSWFDRLFRPERLRRKGAEN